jgi:predicted phage-related endonuclease
MTRREFDNQDDWLQERANYICSTDTAALFACSRWHSLRSLWDEKRNKRPNKRGDSSPHAEFGKEQQPLVAAEFKRSARPELELIDPGPFTLFLPDAPEMAGLRLAASMDYLTAEHGRPVECKTAWNEQCDEWEFRVPLAHQLQMQTQLAVLGVDMGYFAVRLFRFGPPTFRLHPIKRDDQVITEICRRVQQFWRLVDENIHPAVDGSEHTARVLRVEYNRSDDTEVVLENPLLVDNRNELELIDLELSELKKRKELLRQRFMDAMGNNITGRLADGRRVWWKPDVNARRRLTFERW